MIKFDIFNRFTSKVQFTAEIDCDENEAKSVKIGLAVKWAVKSGAYLSSADLGYADLSSANLSSANLGYADLRGANLNGAREIETRIIDGGVRSDGYRFYLTRVDDGEWRIKAGCRNLTLTDAEKHWNLRRPKGDPLGDETRLIIDHMTAVAKLRKWPKEGEVYKAEAAE